MLPAFGKQRASLALCNFCYARNRRAVTGDDGPRLCVLSFPFLRELFSNYLRIILSRITNRGREIALPP